MKLLRVGDKGKEIPAIVDNKNNYRDLSSLVDDLKPSTLNFEILKKIKDSDISKLPIVSKDQRIGSCINKPGKFIAIGLNYSDHAKETGAKTPTEPIVFMKATSSICGPNDEIEIPKGSNKLDWEVELAFVVGKDTKNITEKDAVELYKEFYKSEPFIKIVDAPPATKHTWGSNYVYLYPYVREDTNTLVVISALDNLVKGSAGAAIQNMNLMQGFEETMGISALPVYP